MNFDWHSAPITRYTPLDRGYRNTQNVRRFLTEACGPSFHFDRAFMVWLKSGEAKTMGQVADHWKLMHRR
nr:DUF6434 domain-containing protein [uncultured Pseudomonas sp.]